VLLASPGFMRSLLPKHFLPAEAFHHLKRFVFLHLASFWRGSDVRRGGDTGAMFISHRMVGPAHRLADEIRRHNQSTHPETPIRVREGDELEDVVQAITN